MHENGRTSIIMTAREMVSRVTPPMKAPAPISANAPGSTHAQGLGVRNTPGGALHAGGSSEISPHSDPLTRHALLARACEHYFAAGGNIGGAPSYLNPSHFSWIQEMRTLTLQHAGRGRLTAYTCNWWPQSLVLHQGLHAQDCDTTFRPLLGVACI